MALNPILFTERVVADFLRYQLTTYAFADPRLREQMRRLLSFAEIRRSPLLKGPDLSLSRAFRPGAALTDLAAEGATVPDAFFPGQDGEPGVCVYLDGLSDGIHGRPETAATDAQLREALRNRGYEVVDDRRERAQRSRCHDSPLCSIGPVCHGE